MAATPITPAEFDAADDVAEWRILGDGLCAYFPASGLAAAAAVAAAIARLDGTSERRPDLDVHAEGVHARILTHTPQLYGLTDADLDLARAISAAAAEHALRPDPAKLQTVQLTIDAMDIDAIKPFWRAVLDYVDRADSPEDLIDPRRRGVTIWFQQMDAPRPQRNRMHLDVWVPKEDAEARVAAAIAAGGRVVYDRGVPTWWVLADAEGNEVCVTSIEGRD